MFLFKIALRNILRQKKRFILSLLTLFFCFFFLAIGISLSEGSYATVIDIFTSTSTGHLRIYKDSYLYDEDFYKTINIKEDKIISSALSKVKEIKSFSKRINTNAIIINNDKTYLIKLLGVYPEIENNTTKLKDKLTEGEYLSSLSTNEILISIKLKNLLKLELNQAISIIANAYDGSIFNDNFKIIGFIDCENNYLNFKSLSNFLNLNSNYHEIVINIDDYKKASKLKTSIKNLINNDKINISSWQELKSNFYKTMLKEKEGVWILLLIVAFISALIILNTVMMNILERKKEYALIKALGLSSFKLFTLILMETKILSFIAIFLGIIFTYIINFYLIHYGISYPEPVSVSGVKFYKMYGSNDFIVYFIPFLVTSLITFFISIIPAYKVANLKSIVLVKKDIESC